MLRALILRSQLHWGNRKNNQAFSQIPPNKAEELGNTQISTDRALLAPKGLHELHQTLIYTIISTSNI